MGPEGFLFSYSEDVYMGGEPVHVAHTLAAALDIYTNVGLQLGWGPKKKELVLPSDCDPDCLPLPHNLRCEPLPDIVQGFKVCLGVPRHPTGNNDFILGALRQLAIFAR
jgi:hypothetical protein